MDVRAIWTMTLGDLRQRLRDGSVLVFGLAVPFALILVFNFLFSGLGDEDSFDAVTVAVSSPADDDLAGALVAAVSSLQGLMDVTIDEVGEDAVRAAVPDEDADVGIIVPADFTSTVTGGGSADVEVVTDGGGGLEQQVVVAVVDGFVDRVAAGSEAAAAAAATGLAPDEIAAIAQQVGQAESSITTSPGEPADEQLSLQGGLVAGQAALFMLFTVSFGVVGYLHEREMGTLPRLQSMPIRPRSIIVAKTVVSFLLGLLATTVLLVAGSLLFDVSWGGIVPVGVLVGVTVAAATSLVLLVAKVARTAEQAQTAQSILAMVLGILGGAFFPVGGSGLLATLSDLTPPGSFIRGLGITQAGGGVVDLAGPLANVAGFLVLAALLAAVLPDREVVA